MIIVIQKNKILQYSNPVQPTSKKSQKTGDLMIAGFFMNISKYL